MIHKKLKIPFVIPDITNEEINEVIKTLKSGWITTGPKTKLFEKSIAKYYSVKKALCLSSATIGLELLLRVFDIGFGDEVITTPYTFASTANVILHTGARVVFVDVKEDDFNIDPFEIEKAITEKTKAIISVDFAGFPVDYSEIKELLQLKKKMYRPKKNTFQELIDRPILLSDSAHSFGARYKGKLIGGIADFTVFSFHAVKNLTTAEGGAIIFNDNFCFVDEIYNKLRLLILHGQDKDAFSKFSSGKWYYSIELAGFKANMTDISASLGLAQLRRYNSKMLPKRKLLFKKYLEEFSDDSRFILPPFKNNFKESSCHIFALRIAVSNEVDRASLINNMANCGISLNVHFIPVVSHPIYKRLGYKLEDYPISKKLYFSEISLPLYSSLKMKDLIYVCKKLKKLVTFQKI